MCGPGYCQCAVRRPSFCHTIYLFRRKPVILSACCLRWWGDHMNWFPAIYFFWSFFSTQKKRPRWNTWGIITRSSTLRDWGGSRPFHVKQHLNRRLFPQKIKERGSKMCLQVVLELSRSLTVWQPFLWSFLFRAFFRHQNAEHIHGDSQKLECIHLLQSISDSDQSQPRTSGMNQAQKSKRSTNRVTPLGGFGGGQVDGWAQEIHIKICISTLLSIRKLRWIIFKVVGIEISKTQHQVPPSPVNKWEHC